MTQWSSRFSLNATVINLESDFNAVANLEFDFKDTVAKLEFVSMHHETSYNLNQW